jgi:hypothetical protein
MKIKEVTEDEIVFDNGMTIKSDFDQDCCEWNYADVKQIEPLTMGYEFDEELIFEEADYGFRFGDKKQMFFIPCYSDQNGCYSPCVDIYFNGKRVLKGVMGEVR